MMNKHPSVSQGRIALIVGLVVLTGAATLTLTGSPPRALRVGEPSNATLASTTRPIAACQTEETIPAGTSAIRVGLEGSIGPAIRLKAFANGRTVAQGGRRGDWTDDSVTIPVKPVAAATHSAKVCFYVPEDGELLHLYGVHTGPQTAARTTAGQPLAGRFSVAYLASSGRSWWSRLREVARHMGVGHAVSGSLVALIVFLLMAALAVLFVRLAWRLSP